jgi:hypothetical protein
MALLCEECEGLLQEYWVIDAEIRKVARKASDVRVSRESELLQKPWKRWSELIEESAEIRNRFLKHLKSHSF